MDSERRKVTRGLGGMLCAGMMGSGPLTWAMSRNPDRLPIEGEAPSLAGSTAWLNSAPLSGGQLLGKVVLVDFWTYSCINWRRSLPYVRAWAQKYRDQGLIVVGAHSPEFQFETVIDNVRRAVQDMDLGYPIAIDNQYQLWNAFENKYWPALYLIDARGRIRYHHFGEGDYAQGERNIQQLLREAGASEVGAALVSVEGSGVEASPDFANLKSPESYLGYGRSERFVSNGRPLPNEPCQFRAPALLGMNHWALAGTWVVGAQSIALMNAGGRIAYAFHARDLHLVMGPGAAGTAVRFRVTIDGQPPGDAHGLDVDADGNGTISEFAQAGAEAYSFTFG